MSTTKSDKLRATPEQVFSLATRFATEVNSWNLAGETVQAAKDEKDHPVWAAIRNVLNPQPEALVQHVVEKDEVFISRIEVLSERPKPCALRSDDEQVGDLKRMYAKLRWTWTDSGLVISKSQKGFDRILVFGDTGFTNNQCFGVCKNSFPSWRYSDDLDSAIPAKNDQRHPSRGAYVIRVRDRVGPDSNLLGLSANQIVEQGLQTMTLLEYMVFKLVHFWETGEHLDPQTWTLCSGSRDSDGYVPYANWCVDKFRVYGCRLDGRDPYIGARQAVTL